MKTAPHHLWKPLLSALGWTAVLGVEAGMMYLRDRMKADCKQSEEVDVSIEIEGTRQGGYLIKTQGLAYYQRPQPASAGDTPTSDGEQVLKDLCESHQQLESDKAELLEALDAMDRYASCPDSATLYKGSPQEASNKALINKHRS